MWITSLHIFNHVLDLMHQVIFLEKLSPIMCASKDVILNNGQ
jgi:hypothetical protein